MQVDDAAAAEFDRLSKIKGLGKIGRCDLLNAAIALANKSVHGLSAYAFTRDAARMFRLAELLEAGTISINDGLPTASQCPFGGLKQSGIGRKASIEGVLEYLQMQTITTHGEFA